MTELQLLWKVLLVILNLYFFLSWFVGNRRWWAMAISIVGLACAVTDLIHSLVLHGVK